MAGEIAYRLTKTSRISSQSFYSLLFHFHN